VIRKILVPVRGDGKGDNVLAHAAALAHRHGSHIEIVHCRPRPEDLMPYGVAIPEFLRKQLIKQSYEVADQEEAGLRAEIEALARSLDLDFADSNPGARPTVTFVEEAGRQVDVIKRHGRLSDIIAVARPDRDRNLGKNTLKAALFQSGRPVLMCPPAETPPKVLGARIALAWNGSAEAARALAQSRNALMRADIVWVLTNGADSGPGTTVEDLATYLGMHGVTPEVVNFKAKSRIGAELLKTSAELGADTLVMGAYGDSHERETVFGGNTQQVVDGAEIPVLLSH
jgi:nucleotide-binding universal stress UspA family protein